MTTDESRKFAFSLVAIVCVLFVFSIFYYYYSLFSIFELTGKYGSIIHNYLKKLDIAPAFYQFKLILSGFIVCVCIMYYPKKDQDATYKEAIYAFVISILLLITSEWLFAIQKVGTNSISLLLYFIGIIFIAKAGMAYKKVMSFDKKLIEDPHNDENETFLQVEEKIENEYSVNIQTKYQFQGKERTGWLNLINLFRGLIVIGTPGSGKSFAIIEEIMFQLLSKFFTMVIYDFKFATLTKIAYNYVLILNAKYKNDPEKLERLPKFYVINFDDIALTNRANPIDPYLMEKQSDATNAATTIMLNLNKDWIKSQNFFAKSAISYVSGLNWFLKLMSEKYGKNICTLPHVIMLSTVNLDILLDILMDSMEVRQLLVPFKEALEREAQEQLAGQTASAQISLSQMATKEIFYVMSESDFTLDINNPNKPKILCIGNNPKRKEIYAAPIGLYFSKILQVINQKGKLPIGVIIDELPTIFINGLDDFIATARSNKAATILGIQSIGQMIKDYGKEVSDVIYDICANIVTGSAKGVTADYVSKLFGKIKQKRESHTISKNDTTTSISMQMDNLLPISKLASLTQGFFAGVVADNFDQRIPQKLFHAEIVADMELKEKQEKISLPLIRDFRNKNFQTDTITKEKELLAIDFYANLYLLDLGYNNYIEFYNFYIVEQSKSLYKAPEKQESFIENCKWLKIFEHLGPIQSIQKKAKRFNWSEQQELNKIKSLIKTIIENTYIEKEKDVVLHDNYIKIIKEVDVLVKEEYYRINGEYPEFGIFDESKLTDNLKEVVSELTPDEIILNKFTEKLKEKSEKSKVVEKNESVLEEPLDPEFDTNSYVEDFEEDIEQEYSEEDLMNDL